MQQVVFGTAVGRYLIILRDLKRVEHSERCVHIHHMQIHPQAVRGLGPSPRACARLCVLVCAVCVNCTHSTSDEEHL